MQTNSVNYNTGKGPMNAKQVWAIHTRTTQEPTSVTITNLEGETLFPTKQTRVGEMYIIEFNTAENGEAILIFT